MITRVFFYLDLAALTVHHGGHLCSDLLTGFADRIAHSANISVCHFRCLVSEQVAQNMRANTRGCRPCHHRAPQVMQSHFLYTGSSGNLGKVGPHCAIGGWCRSRAGERPCTTKPGKLGKKRECWRWKVMDPAARSSSPAVSAVPSQSRCGCHWMPKTSPIRSPVSAATRIAATDAGYCSSCWFSALASAASSDGDSTRSRASSRARSMPYGKDLNTLLSPFPLLEKIEQPRRECQHPVAQRP